MNLTSELSEAIGALDASAERIKETLSQDISGILTSETHAVQQEIDSIQSLLMNKLDTIKTEIGQICYRVYREHNSRLPVNRLPQELLLLVFEYVLEQSSAFDHYLDLAQLFRVCSHWNALSMNSPSLWSQLSCDYSRRRLETILQRSGSVPLRLQQWSGPMPRQLLGLHLLRCRSILLSYFSAQEQSALTAGPNPWLKYLEIRHGRHGSARHWVSPFNSSTAPNLRGFRLSEADLTPYASNFSTLRVLHLSDLSEPYSSLNQVATILRANPLLVHVALQRVQSPATNIPGSRAPIVLPSLKTLDMDGVGATLAVIILSALQAPQLKRLNVMTRIVPDGTGEEQNRVSLIMRCIRILTSASLFSMPPSTVDVHIPVVGFENCHVGRFDVDYQTLESHYHVGQELQFPIALDDLCAIMGESGVDLSAVETSVHLVSPGMGQSLSNEWLQTLNAKLGHIRSICLCPDIPDPQWENEGIFRLCMFLSQRVDGAWPFPALRELDLDLYNPGDVDAIFLMVGTRSSEAGSAPLARLNLRAVEALSNFTAVADIMAALPSGAVCNEPHRKPSVAECWGQSQETDSWFWLPVGERASNEPHHSQSS